MGDGGRDSVERSRSELESGIKGDVGEEVAEVSISKVESDSEIGLQCLSTQCS